jgi:hypothetical protein
MTTRFPRPDRAVKVATKLAGLYRGPLVIESIVRPDVIKGQDLLSNAISLILTSNLYLSQIILIFGSIWCFAPNTSGTRHV